MSTDFSVFREAIRQRFESLDNSAYVVDVDREHLWATYLDAFPPGTNEIFRERREYDCNCCRQFLYRLGHVVWFEGNERTSIWDVRVPEPFATVCREMSEYVNRHSIVDKYLTDEKQAGTEKSVELTDGQTHIWHHFNSSIPSIHFSRTPDRNRGYYKTSVQMLERALIEIDSLAVKQVLELVEDNNLYRGDEFKLLLREFEVALCLYRQLGNDREQFLWENAISACSRIRNTAIGTLLVDLSEGTPLDVAVKRFEDKVAPQNYQRSKSLITQTQIDKALSQITELGYADSVKRRHARLSDLSVNDVLFVDNQAQVQMRDSLRDALASSLKPVKPSKTVSTMSTVSMEEFLENVRPLAQSMQVLFENQHKSRLVSLTAPAVAGSRSMFKWHNPYGWSYIGELADSGIKEKVKKAGGATDGKLRVSLAWYNTDDLDLHCYTPNNKHICYVNKYDILDVDMNAGTLTEEPVENMNFKTLPNGAYLFTVNQFAERNVGNKGYTLEVECNGQVRTFSRSTSPAHKRKHKALSVVVKEGEVIQITPGEALTEGETRSEEVWSLQTNQWVNVQLLTLSPNHWGDSQVGNKHYLFVLEGCKDPEPVRCFYNEFLRGELREERKVMEILGDKLKAPYSEDQLSGLGFSSTQEGSVQIRVQGKKNSKAFNRIYKVEIK